MRQRVRLLLDDEAEGGARGRKVAKKFFRHRSTEAMVEVEAAVSEVVIGMK
ncbi:UNVERIFIED_CONTAM: hypothetical protein Slati_3648400 [Sesamum latifolium]|uniref:Uncharacterized protein n=1 Tax=Sesamum latifolium TaxID=2727402 RepID=A0AAW2U251_9LAMI